MNPSLPRRQTKHDCRLAKSRQARRNSISAIRRLYAVYRISGKESQKKDHRRARFDRADDRDCRDSEAAV